MRNKDTLDRLASFISSKIDASLRDRDYGNWQLWKSFKKQIGKYAHWHKVTETSSQSERDGLVVHLYELYKIDLEGTLHGLKTTSLPTLRRYRERRLAVLNQVMPLVKPVADRLDAQKNAVLRKLTIEERKLLNVA